VDLKVDSDVSGNVLSPFSEAEVTRRQNPRLLKQRENPTSFIPSEHMFKDAWILNFTFEYNVILSCLNTERRFSACVLN
jgi:hypothetical protein